MKTSNTWTQGAVKNFYLGDTIDLSDTFEMTSVDMDCQITVTAYESYYHYNPDTVMSITFTAVGGAISATTVAGTGTTGMRTMVLIASNRVWTLPGFQLTINP